MSETENNTHTSTNAALLEQTTTDIAVPGKQHHVALSDLALPQAFAELAGTTTEAATPKLKKPNSQSFFAVHPDQTLWKAFAFIKDQNSRNRDEYVVAPDLIGELGREVKPKVLLPCISMQGIISFWPVGLPGKDGKMNDWHQSAYTHATNSGGGWMRLSSVDGEDGYSLTRPIAEWTPPVWPEDILSLMEKAIQANLIIDMQHPLVARLRGAA